jgi:hypothetical protein
MKNLIRKILKEEEFEWIDENLPSPRQIMDHAAAETRWVAYIPEISRKIKFYVNPEEWNHMASVRVEKIESRGHGSFGDNSHKDFRYSPLDHLYTDEPGSYSRTWYDNKNYIDQDEHGRNMVNIMDAVKDMREYSNEAAQLTIEYKKQIQELTKNYAEALRQLKPKYNYGSSSEVELVVLDDEGIAHDNDDFENLGWDYPGREEIRDKKPRNL